MEEYDDTKHYLHLQSRVEQEEEEEEEEQRRTEKEEEKEWKEE